MISTPDRRTGGTTGVLQVGHVVDADERGPEIVCRSIGNLVDGDDRRALGQRGAVQEGFDRLAGPRGRQDRRGPGVPQRGVETLRVPGQLRREQGHRDRSGVERGEEAGDVVQALG